MLQREERYLDALKAIGVEAPPIDPKAIDTDEEGESTSTTEETVGEATPTVEAAPSPSPTPLSISNVFMHHDTHPVLLGMMLLGKYGVEWLDWEPETLRAEIKDDFRQPSISVHNWNKIQAVKTLHLVPSPWTSWEVFVPTCQAVNNNIPDFRTMRKPTPSQVMVAVDIFNTVKKRDFGGDVPEFIAACFVDEGVFYIPPPADFAQSHVGLFEIAPNDIRRRYEECVRKGDDRDELQEAAVDVQVAKLLLARDYMLLRRQQLTEQAGVIGNVRT